MRVVFPTLDSTQAYVYDVRTGRTELVSDGAYARFSNVNAPNISGNGRYVTFTARPVEDTGGRSLIRLRDLGRGAGEWLDVPSAGEERWVATPSLSHDGRHIAYLASGPGTDGAEGSGTHVYALDRRTDKRMRVDPECADDPAEYGVSDPVMSPDGRHVVFRFKCRTLRPGGTNDTGDVFLKDLRSGTLRHILGPKPQFATHTGRLSADGRHIVFVAAEEREPRGPLQVIYLLDLRTGRTDMVTARPDGTVNQRPASDPTLDAHGRAVAYDAVPRDLLGSRPPAVTDRSSSRVRADGDCRCPAEPRDPPARGSRAGPGRWPPVGVAYRREPERSRASMSRNRGRLRPRSERDRKRSHQHRGETRWPSTCS